MNEIKKIDIDLLSTRIDRLEAIIDLLIVKLRVANHNEENSLLELEKSIGGKK